MAWQHHLYRDRHQDWSDEFASHIDIATDEYIAKGMSPEEAATAARRRFGNPTLQREQIYQMNTIAFLDSLSRDVRYGLRVLGRNKGFTAAVLLTLAIGIGANTAVFTVLDSVLLRPLAYPRPDELVVLRQMAPGAEGIASQTDGLRLSASMYFTYSDQNRAFQSLGVWNNQVANVTGTGLEPEQVRTIVLTDGVLQSLGVAPAVGSWLTKPDHLPNARQKAMLSWGYWQRRFGGDPSAVGRDIVVDAQSREIVGVMPRGFRLADTDADVILPLPIDRARATLAGFGLRGIARLKPRVSIAQADADLVRMLPIWMNSWTNGPGTNGKGYERWKITPAIRLLKADVIGDAGDLLWAVMGTIGLVMLVACASVTNLLLVRADARQQELAIRASLGAGRRRIVRELLVESVMLGMFGGVLGAVIAWAGVRLLVAFGPRNMPRLAEISIGGRELAFAALLSVIVGFLLGLVPALKYAGSRLAGALRSSTRTSSASRERHRARNVLVISQVAMALVLLVCAGLMIRTFHALETVDPGFTDPRHLQILRVAIPNQLIAEPARVIRTQKAIADKLEAIPGVTAVGFADAMAMEDPGHMWDSIVAADKTNPRGEIPPLRWYKYVSPGFFHAAGTRLVAGRDLTWSEMYGGRPVALVSANLARELWSAPSAGIGKRIREGSFEPWQEVIGVVEDVHENGANEDAPAIVYWPVFKINGFAPGPLNAMRAVTFIARSDRAGTESFLAEVRQAVWSVSASLPVAAPRTMQDVYGRSLERTSFTLTMLVIAGAMALLLGVIGIYGVISYSVSQRRREIGIRLALGAPRGELRSMFVRHGSMLFGIGAIIGLAASVGVTQLLKSLLFGVSPLDPMTYVAVPLVLGSAVLLASYLPARRASLADPTEALRME
jgi:predicted permease